MPETTCDDIDNDCNGVVDDPFTTKNQACNDGKLGVCQGTGTFQCNAMKNGVTCKITKPGGSTSAETCNGKDDDCDGVVDNGASTGNLPGQNWITLATGHQIMAFEAARPDASAISNGVLATQPCSKTGVLPWVDVTAPQAQAACVSVGAHLCSEEEWQRACAVVTPTVYPVSEPGTGTGDIFIEAEDAQAIASGTDAGGTVRAWEPDYTQGFSGMMALRAEPDTGADLSAANAPAQAPRLDFQVNFTKTGNHTIYVHMYGINPGGTASSGNRVWVGINATVPGTANATTLSAATGSWGWIKSAQINVTTTGNKFVSIYMRRDGVKVDAIIVSQSSTLTPTTTTGTGNTFAYDTTPNTYQPSTCNGLDYDTDALTPGNQDDIIPTGTLTSCDANWSGAQAFDLQRQREGVDAAARARRQPDPRRRVERHPGRARVRAQLLRRRRQLLLPERRLPLLPLMPPRLDQKSVPTASPTVSRVIESVDVRIVGVAGRRQQAVVVVALVDEHRGAHAEDARAGLRADAEAQAAAREAVVVAAGGDQERQRVAAR